MHQKYVEFDLDGLSDTWGNIWQKIAANELDCATLVNGKNPSELLNDNPKVKDDLDIMLACCRAELQRADIRRKYTCTFLFQKSSNTICQAKVVCKRDTYMSVIFGFFKRLQEKKRSKSCRQDITR